MLNFNRSLAKLLNWCTERCHAMFCWICGLPTTQTSFVVSRQPRPRPSWLPDIRDHAGMHLPFRHPQR